MRLGIDVDGVLADFQSAWVRRVVRATGRDLYPAGDYATRFPCWDHMSLHGYTSNEIDETWKAIAADPTFWLTLSPCPGTMETLGRLRALSLDHDLYFITARPGVMAKQQTEVWLSTHSGDIFWTPTVLISGDKEKCCAALNLNAYIDDRDMNCDLVQRLTSTRTFIVNQPWNRAYHHPDVERVASVDEMLGRLGLDETTGAPFGQVAA